MVEDLGDSKSSQAEGEAGWQDIKIERIQMLESVVKARFD